GAHHRRQARHRIHHRCGRALRKGERHMYRSHVMVCGGTGCTSSNSDKIAQAFEAEIQATGLQDEVKVIRTGCFGLCALGPIVVIYPEGSFYSMVKEENVK